MPGDSEMEQYGNRNFWIGLNPSGHIEDKDYLRQIQLLDPDEEYLDALLGRFHTEGYFQLKQQEWAGLVQRCQSMIRKLEEESVPTVFAFMYDELWELFYKLHHVLQRIFGGRYQIMPEFWVWSLNPAKQDSGWKPHRDRGPDSLFPDGRPKCITVWIPLTAATPDNGCIYVVPADRDRNYGDPGEKAYDGFDLAAVRAIPAAPGEVLCWNQAILHWGAQATRFADGPRVSVAMEFQDAAVPPMCKPLLRPSSVLSFGDRLRLCVAQVMAYQEQYQFSPETISILRTVLARVDAKKNDARKGV
jgi:hypothetical protein